MAEDDRLSDNEGKYGHLDSIAILHDFEPEMESDEHSRFYDAVLASLIENGQVSEKELLEVFEYLCEKRDQETKEGVSGEIIRFTEEDDFYYKDEEGDLRDTDYKSIWDKDFFRKSAIISALGEFESATSKDAIIDFLKKGGVEFYKIEIAEALSKNNVEYSAQELLRLLKDKNELIRKDAGKILYRLEMGKIGISEEGVKYLDRLYDLGEHNNPNFFTQRLTADGDIGVFGENRELLKYFNLGDLSDGQTRVKVAVLDFTYETLFTPKANETQEDRVRREKVLEEFQKKYFNFYNFEFFQNTRVHFNNLSFREQGWFLHFVENSDEKRKQEALEFVRKYGEEGLRTFLSLDYGDEMGNKILEIGKNIPDQAARAIFSKYGQIIDSAGEAGKFVKEKLKGSENVPPEFLNKISNNLTLKSKELLVEFGGKLRNPQGEDSVKEILKQLESIKTEILLFAVTFRASSEKRDLEFFEIAATNIDAKDSSQLTQEEKSEMLEIFKGNRSNYDPERLKASIKDFEEVLDSKGKEFNLLKHQGRLISFIRFDQLPNGNLYAGSLNVRRELHDSRIGMAMLRTTLDKKAETDNIEAIAYCKLPMLKHYVGDFGFKIVGELPNYHGGEMYYQLFRPKKLAKAA